MILTCRDVFASACSLPRIIYFWLAWTNPATTCERWRGSPDTAKLESPRAIFMFPKTTCSRLCRVWVSTKLGATRKAQYQRIRIPGSQLSVKIAEINGAPVAQLNRASAFEAQLPVPKLPFVHFTFQSFQQLGESATRSKLSPTPRIDRVLAQFWHS